MCVSDTFDQIRVAKAIIEDLGESASGLNEFQSLMSRIQSLIKGKKNFFSLMMYGMGITINENHSSFV